MGSRHDKQQDCTAPHKENEEGPSSGLIRTSPQAKRPKQRRVMNIWNLSALCRTGDTHTDQLFVEPYTWGFPKIRGTILGVPIIRTIVYWGLYWGPLI